MSNKTYAITPRILLCEKLPKIIQEISYPNNHGRTMIFVNSKMTLHIHQNIYLRCIIPVSEKLHDFLFPFDVETYHCEERFVVDLEENSAYCVFVIDFKRINSRLFEEEIVYSQDNLKLLIEHCNIVANDLSNMKSCVEIELSKKIDRFMWHADDERAKLGEKIRAKYSLPDVPKDQSILQYHNAPI